MNKFRAVAIFCFTVIAFTSFIRGIEEHDRTTQLYAACCFAVMALLVLWKDPPKE